MNELTLDGILRQIDGMQPLDYNTQKHVNLDLPIQFSDQYGNLASVRNNNICMIILSGADSNTQMTYNYRSRIRFSDY